MDKRPIFSSPEPPQPLPPPNTFNESIQNISPIKKPFISCREQDLHFLADQKPASAKPISEFFDQMAIKINKTMQNNSDEGNKRGEDFTNDVPNLEMEDFDENEDGELVSSRL